MGLGFEVGVLVRVFGVGVFSFQVFAVCGVGPSGVWGLLGFVG